MPLPTNATWDPDRRAPDLVAKLTRLADGKRVPGYISHIRFPRFKNLRPGARIDFTFPVTALVGPNGGGKTSALHALYGAPRGRSTSDFWFATDLDPIKEGNGEPNRFIYGHWLPGAGAFVETRKARVTSLKSRRPGYFEPTKAVVGDAMDVTPFVPTPPARPVPGQAKDRWNPVDRPLLYMNFRSELSAFDKYLFWGNPKPTKRLSNKYERLQLGARRLKQALDSGAATTELRGQPALVDKHDLSAHELACVCGILGKSYASAQLLRHRYYGSEEGVGVLFRTARGATYSEAFAGSGELAVASLVVKLCAAEPNSLVLLDEPEVSLHPGAQERLLVFLLQEALARKHQIVFTTHSPGLVRHLPARAVKVFVQTADGYFDVLEESHPYAAFNRLGAPVPNGVRVLVEDRLAKYVVELALRRLDDHERGLFEVEFLPGGADSYYAHRIPTLMFDASPPYVLLDGDQTPAAPAPNPDTIPASEDGTLDDAVKAATGGVRVALLPNGGNDPEVAAAEAVLRRKYLRFLHDRVRYLPRSCPEEIVIRAIDPSAGALAPAEAKQRLSAVVEDRLGRLPTAEEIDNWALMRLSEFNRNADLETIAGTLRSMLSSVPTT